MRVATLGWWNETRATRHRLAWATRLPALNAMAFLAGTAFPSADYVHSRHGSFRNYWKNGWRETVLTAHGSDYRMTTIDDYESQR
jgi:ribosome modulation factor